MRRAAPHPACFPAAARRCGRRRCRRCASDRRPGRRTPAPARTGKRTTCALSSSWRKRQVPAVERAAGQPAGIDRSRRSAASSAGDAHAAAIGLRRDVVDGIEVERHARRQRLALAFLGKAVGQPVDQPHLAAARLAAQIVEIAAVEPVDDADQPQARGRAIFSQRMSMTRPALAAGELVAAAARQPSSRRATAAMSAPIVSTMARVGRRLAVEAFEIVVVPLAPNRSPKAVALRLELGRARRLVDEEHRLFGGAARRQSEKHASKRQQDRSQPIIALPFLARPQVAQHRQRAPAAGPRRSAPARSGRPPRHASTPPRRPPRRAACPAPAARR